MDYSLITAIGEGAFSTIARDFALRSQPYTVWGVSVEASIAEDGTVQVRSILPPIDRPLFALIEQYASCDLADLLRVYHEADTLVSRAACGNECFRSYYLGRWLDEAKCRRTVVQYQYRNL